MSDTNRDGKRVGESVTQTKRERERKREAEAEIETMGERQRGQRMAEESGKRKRVRIERM